MSDKEDPERRVYNLPAELVARIRAYQADQGVSSETEAVRRLLDFALAMRDSIDDVLNKLSARFPQEKDLRVLARDILTSHPLVKTVHFGDRDLVFYFDPETRGKIDANGETYIGGWTAEDWSPRAKSVYTTRGAGKTKQAIADLKTKASDLDDDIPF